MTDDKMPPNGHDRPAQAEPEEAKPEETRRPADRSQANASPPGQRVAPGRGPLFRT